MTSKYIDTRDELRVVQEIQLAAQSIDYALAMCDPWIASEVDEDYKMAHHAITHDDANKALMLVELALVQANKMVESMNKKRKK